jgi:hypothetical protein
VTEIVLRELRRVSSFPAWGDDVTPPIGAPIRVMYETTGGYGIRIESGERLGEERQVTAFWLRHYTGRDVAIAAPRRAA